MSKQTNIPALRFKEFKGEWEKKRLGEVAEFKAGYAFKSEQMLSEKSNFQLLKMSNVYKNELRLDRNASYWEKLSNKEKEFLLRQGDTILTLTGTVGKQDYGYSVQIKENNKYLLNQRLVLLREIKEKSNNDFISQIISNEKFLFYFFGEAKGGTGNQTNVGTDDVKNIQLFFPTLPEQTKIANFLTAVDEKLQTLKKKKSLLEDYKKGGMQKLFLQELRFKDDNGNEFADWEVKKLGEVFYSDKGKGISKNKIVEKGKYECILYGELYTKYNEVIFDVVSKTNEEDGTKSKIGDLLIPSSTTTTGIDLANVTALNKEDVLLGGDITVLRSEEKINNVFYAYYLSNHKKEEIASYAQGSTIVHLYYSHIKDMFIDLPCLQEQTHIANFLSSIDEKINHTQMQITQTEGWKNGLLQRMFC